MRKFIFTFYIVEFTYDTFLTTNFAKPSLSSGSITFSEYMAWNMHNSKLSIKIVFNLKKQ